MMRILKKRDNKISLNFLSDLFLYPNKPKKEIELCYNKKEGIFRFPPFYYLYSLFKYFD